MRLRIPAPLRLRPFRRLLAAYAVNALGNWLGEIALAAVVLHETGSPAAVAAVFAAGQFIPALAGPPLVARVERLRASVALPLLHALQGVLYLALAIVVVSGFSLTLVLLLATLDGVLGLAARALARASTVAVTEPHDLLPEGNAILTLAFTASMAAGPVLAGVAVALLSPQGALMLDAASFALAAALLGVRSELPVLPVGPGTVAGRLRAAVHHVRSDLALRRLIVGYGILALLASSVLPIEIVLVTDTLGGDTAAFGAVLALWGAGSVVGGALLGLLRRAPLGLLVSGSFAVYAVSYLGMGTAGSIEAVAIFSFMGGTANGIESFAVITSVQRRTPAGCQARMSGLVESVTTAALGTGFLLGGLLAVVVSPRSVYVLAGAGILLVAVWMAPRPTWIAQGPGRIATAIERR